MKYIYAIIGIAVLVSAGTWFAVRTPQEPDAAPVLVVNGRQFSQKELDERMAAQPYQSENQSAFVDGLVLRELLIQDAKRRGIDQEEAFRWSIQNFYEQTLIKVMMDRRYEELKADADPGEIERYARFVDRKVVMTEFKLTTPEEKANPASTKGRSITERFEFLSESVQYSLSTLDPGQFTPALHQDAYDVVYRLDGIVMEPVKGGGVDREAIRRVISDQKTAAAVDKWMEGLKTSAKVEMHLKK
jgi:hypothetical protein